jgi:hypothetical protein
MDSLKRIMKSAMADRSPRFMLATIALGVVVALIAGTFIGYKLDDSGSGGTAAPARAAAVKRKPTKKKAKARVVLPVLQPVLYGTIVNTRPAKIVVLGATNKRVAMVIGPTTKAETAEASSSSSIAVGARVLYTPKTGETTTATEIVVFPSTSAFGLPITAVSPSTSMTLNGTLVIKTNGAKVYKANTSSAAQIPMSSKVSVSYVAARRRNAAVEVAILPSPATKKS